MQSGGEHKSYSVTSVTHFPGKCSVTRSDFLYGMSIQMRDLLKVIPFMRGEGRDRRNYSKRFYEYVSSQAELAEILLDSCGAKENRAWFFLREIVAAIRSISKAAYVLRYLELRISTYDILDEDISEFEASTVDVRKMFDGMLQKAFFYFANEAEALAIEIPQIGVTSKEFPFFYTPGHLNTDMWVENSNSENEAIVKIASSYLEIADEYTSLGYSRIFSPEELIRLVPEHVNEERLRSFEADVHNLQSVYDTYIGYSRMEANDPRLGQLRGCLSIALHLLEIATVLVHFHERHERSSRHVVMYQRLQEITGTCQILDAMGNYALFYCTRFLQKGKELGEEAVMDYAQITSKRIPVPIYRGFHVRPSTYIAKIARHYGTDVQMHLGDEVYDAACVFDLFRANEKINMEKRRTIAKHLAEDQQISPTEVDMLPQTVERKIKELIARKLIAGHQAIDPDDLRIPNLDKSTLSAEEVRGVTNEVITRLLALGKIDIIMPLQVTFIGDRRPLADIEVLARHGYGEDECGNNIRLPEQISYLYK
ncbi:hypothetical protein CSB45_08270 [candidate division KSB3 bacterium]|uniref:HPr domain-containing protein n=1 Tax=candidate division KSB3 bacterium TaxID=2044937 RepID=A0A2G6E559_9BACT|nr:MAG: hypothetical protein CSB45_08270 [candidate division KSB3 bacterium]PIE29785.1 MAG: hypothetical protein CSA57_06945 [candidate division KSB3 bacterium]